MQEQQEIDSGDCSYPITIPTRYRPVLRLALCHLERVRGGCPTEVAAEGNRCLYCRGGSGSAAQPRRIHAGAAIDNGILYEGTGQLGSSRLRRIDLETGLVQQEISLDDALFGEGIAIAGERIVQLTWKAKIGFVYDKKTFERLGEFQYETEGWGLTYDGGRLIMSDGTSTLQFYDPETLEYTGFLNLRSRAGRLMPQRVGVRTR